MAVVMCPHYIKARHITLYFFAVTHINKLGNYLLRHPRCVVWNYKYRQNMVKHNSVILLRCISYIVSFNDMFRL